MHVQLFVANKRQKGQVIRVDVPEFTIGQAEECHLRSNSSRIDQQHCVIHTQGGTVTIQDLGSVTGTYVNGMQISSRKVLKDGDELTVGRHLFVVSIRAKTGAEESETDQNQIFEIQDPDFMESAFAALMSDPHESDEPEQDEGQRYADDDSILSGIEDEPAVSSARTSSDTTGKPLPKSQTTPENLWSSIVMWAENNMDSRHTKICCGVLAVICLMGIVCFFTHTSIYLEGTVMLNGKPEEGASVTLFLNGEAVNGSMTDSKGRFTIETALKAGEYNVTFSKRERIVETDDGSFVPVSFRQEVPATSREGERVRYVIPKRYEYTETSGESIIVAEPKTLVARMFYRQKSHFDLTD